MNGGTGNDYLTDDYVDHSGNGIFLVDKSTYLPTKLVRGIDKLIWIERFNEPGEFKIFGDPLKLLSTLPIGTMLTHANTEEIMIVETHSVDESLGFSAVMEVSGRSISAYIMENRVVSFGYPPGHTSILNDWGDWPEDLWNVGDLGGFSRYPMHYDISNMLSWDAVINLLRECLVYPAIGTVEAIEGLYVNSYLLEDFEDHSSYTALSLTKRCQYLSEAVYGLLSQSDTGLKVVRPSVNRESLEQYFIDKYWHDDPENIPDWSSTVFFIVYKGASAFGLGNPGAVRFDFNRGDIDKVRYLWSTRNDKNAYYAFNETYTYRDYPASKIGWDSRVARINAEDWEFKYIGEVSESEVYMRNRDFLKGRGTAELSRVFERGPILDAIGTAQAGARYRTDYSLGDMVEIFGNYGVNQNMRVVEVATIQDGSNNTIIPTFRPFFNQNYQPPT